MSVITVVVISCIVSIIVSLAVLSIFCLFLLKYMSEYGISCAIFGAQAMEQETDEGDETDKPDQVYTPSDIFEDSREDLFD